VTSSKTGRVDALEVGGGARGRVHARDAVLSQNLRDVTSSKTQDVTSSKTQDVTSSKTGRDY